MEGLYDYDAEFDELPVAELLRIARGGGGSHARARALASLGKQADSEELIQEISKAVLLPFNTSVYIFTVPVAFFGIGGLLVANTLASRKAATELMEGLGETDLITLNWFLKDLGLLDRS